MKEIEDIKSGKIFWDHALEEIILLKFPYYLKQYTGSAQFLSKFQWLFSQK